MNTRLEHATPFLGYFLICLAAAAFHLLFAPCVFEGARGINGSLTGGGLLSVRPLGVIICTLPFAVLFLLYFALSSLAPTLTWAHYTFGLAASSAAGNPDERRSWYQLLDPAITLAAGLACVFKGSHWAGRSVQRDRNGGSSVHTTTTSRLKACENQRND